MVVLGILAAIMFISWGKLPDAGQAGPGREPVPVFREPLRVSPAGPRSAAAPAEIVAGFMQAGAGFDDDHAVARTFLRGTAADRWIPLRRAVIYPQDDSLSFTTTGTGDRRKVTVKTAVWSYLSPSGELELAAPGAVAEQQWQLIRQADSWRIDGLNDEFGLWLPRYEFDRSFLPIKVHFAGLWGQSLLPDVRWFARTGPGLPTAITRTLLAGPPDYLRFAVTSGAPAGTTLGLDAVPIADGVARVDLSENALRANSAQRSALWSQIAATLGQLPTVRKVVLTVGGLPYPAQRADGPLDVTSVQTGEPSPRAGPHLALRSGKIVRIDDFGQRLLTGAGPRFRAEPQAKELRSIAVGGEENILLGVTKPTSVAGRPSTRLVVIEPGRPNREVGRATDLVKPAMDPVGWLWTADRAAPGSLVIANTDRAAKPGLASIRPDWLMGRRVQALDISRDGTRLVVCSLDSSGGSRIDVAGVSRLASGQPQGLDQRRTVGRMLPVAVDVGWADRTTIAVLAGANAGARRPYEIEVGGLMSELPAIPDAARDPASALWASDSREVFVVTQGGRLLVRSGGSWQLMGQATAVALVP